MRIAFSLLLPLVFSMNGLLAQEVPAPAVLEAFVTMRIGHLDEPEWTTASKRISKEAGANVEYVCLRTGILVLRMRDLRVTETADVMALVKRILHEGGVNGTIEFLDIHLERQGPDRC